MVKLFRSISWKELAVLIRDGKVEGQFSAEMYCNGYKSEYGKVVCCFETPRNFTYNGSGIFVELTIPEERIIAEGYGIYENDDDIYDTRKLTIKEFYISHYELSEVTLYSKKKNSTLLMEFQNSPLFSRDFSRIEGKEIKECKVHRFPSDDINTFDVLYKHQDILKDTLHFEGLKHLLDEGDDILDIVLPVNPYAYLAN